ncbi:FKBP-type peptidyl-prolyl cis-trans isomerase [Geofilum sp. OHC36d9]|uniref:FKBP-type peptidyl-prolyl cis-trans isomerase n=1 Tax=Geofilum sp. OHC36d9 TaxID=3458413 RepID=UPI0040335D14
MNKWNSFLIKVLIIAFFSGFTSCSNSQSKRGNKKHAPLTLDETIEMNRRMVDNEQNEIARYVKENNLNLKASETGLWYHIDEAGSGSLIQAGKVVTLAYKVSLLDGTICYSSDSTGYKTFLVGQGGVESGLEEGVLLLKKGSHATFIMPPHLAHGLIGDSEKIPARAILHYEVTVIDVKNK